MMTVFLIEKSVAVHEPRDSFCSCWDAFPLSFIRQVHHQVSVSWAVCQFLDGETFAWALAAPPTVLSEQNRQSDSHRKLLPHFVHFHCVG